MKVFGNTNLPVHELENLTVKAARAGGVTIGSGGSRGIIRPPESHLP